MSDYLVMNGVPNTTPDNVYGPCKIKPTCKTFQKRENRQEKNHVSLNRLLTYKSKAKFVPLHCERLVVDKVPTFLLFVLNSC